jgi:hypothetical protein
MQRRLPAAYPAKAVPPFGSSNNELHSCRLLIAEKRGANNQQEQSKAPLVSESLLFALSFLSVGQQLHLS